MHCDNAPETAAKGGCYICTNPNDVLAFDAVIEGEGVLVLCTACVLDAAAEGRAGRARLAKRRKAEERRLKEAGAA